MPLNTAGTLVTRAVRPAKQRKQPSYFQKRKRGDSLGFAEQCPDIQNSLKRVITAFMLICAFWVFFKWWSYSKAGGVLQPPKGVRGVSNLTCLVWDSHTRHCLMLPSARAVPATAEAQSCALFQDHIHFRSAVCYKQNVWNQRKSHHCK